MCVYCVHPKSYSYEMKPSKLVEKVTLFSGFIIHYLPSMSLALIMKYSVNKTKIRAVLEIHFTLL